MIKLNGSKSDPIIFDLRIYWNENRSVIFFLEVHIDKRLSLVEDTNTVCR